MESNLSMYHIFNTVAAAGSISHAAKELYISQPAISKAIKRLEENLSVTLFRRTSKGVQLTDEGTLLYEYTRSAFDTLIQGEDNIKRINELGIGHLRIGVSTTLCKYILLPYLKNFVETYPHIKVTIECQSTFHTLELLEQNKIDIGLIGKPNNLKNLSFHKLQEIEDVFVATESYLKNLNVREAVQKKTSQQPVQSNHPFILTWDEIFKVANVMLLDEKNMTRLYIDDYFISNHIEPNQILQVSNMDLLIEFAKINLGVSCVIKEFVKEELKDGSLLEIPLQKPLEKREIGFAYKTNIPLTDSTLKFLKFIKDEGDIR
jgi:LysR family transcriptional regulator, cyn operon transcriptional activator